MVRWHAVQKTGCLLVPRRYGGALLTEIPSIRRVITAEQPHLSFDREDLTLMPVTIDHDYEWFPAIFQRFQIAVLQRIDAWARFSQWMRVSYHSVRNIMRN